MPRTDHDLRSSDHDLYALMVRGVREYAIFHVNPAGAVTTWNEGVRAVLGYEEEEWLGQSTAMIFTPEDRKQGAPERELAVAAEAGQAQDDRWHVRKDGSRRWVHGAVTALRDARGELLGFVKIMRDATEARRVEVALRESEERYRSLFESMDEAYAVVEPMRNERGEWSDFLFLEVNPAFMKHTGMEYPVGKTATQLLGTPNPRWAQIYGEVAETGQGVRFEEPELTLGRVFDLYVFRLGGALSRKVAVLFTNVTQRKRVEQELRELNEHLEARVDARTSELRKSEERFRAVFEGAPIPILLAGMGDVISDANPAFESLTGYEREEVRGRHAKELGFWSSPEDQRRLREALGSGDGFGSVELQLRTKHGMVLDIVMSAARIEMDGRGAMVKMFTDVSERKQTERQLQQALQDVMRDTSWLAHSVMEKLAQARRQPGGTQVLVADLTPREREVLSLIAQGRSNEAIGEKLGLAPSTVRNYVTSIYGKIGVGSRAEAVVWARERGLGGL